MQTKSADCLVGSGPVGSGRARVVEFSYNWTSTNSVITKQLILDVRHFQFQHISKLKNNSKVSYITADLSALVPPVLHFYHGIFSQQNFTQACVCFVCPKNNFHTPLSNLQIIVSDTAGQIKQPASEFCKYLCLILFTMYILRMSS